MAIDQAGEVFGTTGSVADNGSGLAYSLAPWGQNWMFSPLYSFLGGANGQNPLPEIIGPKRALYGAADGGIQSCGSSGNQYCGVVYRLGLTIACSTALCSWTENVIYRFTGDPDGWSPNGNLVFDEAGNLYGTTVSGGANGYGTVFELTPSNGGWTEKVIYSFTGGSDGATPTTLLVGHDGNLYGTAANNFFQLAPTGGGWTLQVLDNLGYLASPLSDLVQDSSGNLYAIGTITWYGYLGSPIPTGIIVKVSYSDWGLTTIAIAEDIYYVDYGYQLFYDLAIDATDQLYISAGAMEHAEHLDYYGNIFRVDTQWPWEVHTLVGFRADHFQDLEVDASGKLYGTTSACGSNQGTVWQLTPQP